MLNISYGRVKAASGVRRLSYMIAYALVVLVLLALVLPTATASSAAAPERSTVANLSNPFPVSVSAGSDTLVASPWVQAVFDSWTSERERHFCITSYAAWEKFLFVRYIAETQPDIGCNPGQPIFSQLKACPPNGAKYNDQGAPFIIVECGPLYFRQYPTMAPPPKLPVQITESA